MKTISQETRIETLAKALDVDTDDAERWIDNGDYLVLTDDEADEAVAEYIKNSLWAFNASFIIGECDLDYSLEEMITTWQSEKCEDANDGIRSLIDNSKGGINGFIESAISADGRGHFMSSYDGNEIEEGNYFVYRIN